MNYLVGFLIIVAIGAGVLGIARLITRSSRARRLRRFGSFGWVLLFLSSGRRPPQSQSQIEAEPGEKKNREHTRENP